ncbi:MAG: MBL fold metallo-hydrolase [Nitrospirae bacterium]|nr:MBL fold metallo-hydrolase [Nitrospirota bacterium]
MSAGHHTPAESTPGFFRVKFWGTRGSIATPDPACLGYGGNTACTEVRVDGEVIVIDVGTGGRLLGSALAKEYVGREFTVHLLITHTHWDHIQGFPFFLPAYLPTVKLKIYGPAGTDKPIEKLFRDQMDTSYFPVPLTDLSSSIEFKNLRGGDEFDIGPMRVKAFYLNHPCMALGYRIEAGKKSMAYITDHEPYRHLLFRQNPLATRLANREQIERLDHGLVEFVQGVDLYVCEGQYTKEEYPQKIGWGHTCLDDLVQYGIDAKVKKMLLIHHDPMHDDGFVDKMVAHAQQLIKKSGQPIEFAGAREGFEINLIG